MESQCNCGARVAPSELDCCPLCSLMDLMDHVVLSAVIWHPSDYIPRVVHQCRYLKPRFLTTSLTLMIMVAGRAGRRAALQKLVVRIALRT